MSNSKIEFKIGNIKFLGEGEPTWLSKQLDKVLNKIPELISYNITDSNSTNQEDKTVETVTPETQPKANSANNIAETLATFLRTKKASESHRRKFLATAVYLQVNGAENLVSKNVTDALQKAKQAKLSNPSRQLGQNIKQGFCEKHGKTFYVTQEGVAQIMG